MRSSPALALALVTSLTTGILVSPARAADFIPNRYDDPPVDGCAVDGCSLREAVMAANADSTADRILLSAGTYELTITGTGEESSATGDLDVLENLEIVGAGATMTTIDASFLADIAITAGDPGLVASFRKLALRGSTSGGLHLARGTFTVEDCEMTDNGTLTTDSGIQVTIFGTATIRRTTVAGGSGYGLRVIQSDVTVENSTFSGNGGIDVIAFNAASLTCSHCTIADVGDSDAEIDVLSADTLVTMSNSIVEGNCSPHEGDEIVSADGNLESPGTGCGFTLSNDQDGIADAGLGPLGDHGGQTRTHDLESTSPAIDASAAGNCLIEDQRAGERPLDGPDEDETAQCDGGAVENSGESRPETPIFADGFQQGSTGAWSPLGDT